MKSTGFNSQLINNECAAGRGGEGEKDKDGGGGHTENSVPEAEERPSNHVRQNEISGAAGQGCSGVEIVLHGGREEDGGKSFPRGGFEGKYSLRKAVEPAYRQYCCRHRDNWRGGGGLEPSY